MVLPDAEGMVVVVVVDGAGVVMGVEVVTGGGDWLAAAGAGVDGELEVLDCAKARPAQPMARMASEEVMKLEVFMKDLSKCCRKQRLELAAGCADWPAG